MSDLVQSGENKRGAKWCWASILIFVAACVAGPIGTALQAPQGGDDTMAAAINAAIASGVIMCFGLVVALIAFARERNRPILRWVCLLLYLVPAVGLGIAFLSGLIRK